MAGDMMNIPTIERFNKYTTKTETCWIWNGYKNNQGRSTIRTEKGRILTYRYSYLIHKGEIGNMNVCHSCDNPECVNPDHLFLGTQKDNMHDMIKKGRKKRAGRLKDDEIIEIKRLLKLGNIHQDIADFFKVSRSLITFISHGKRWENIKQEN